MLDTHVLLWAWVSPEKLSPKAFNAIRNPANRRLVSAVTAFEIANKFKAGKLDIEATLVQSYHDHLARFLAEELPLLSRHGLAAGMYSSTHRDPFDRLLDQFSLVLSAQTQVDSGHKADNQARTFEN